MVIYKVIDIEELECIKRSMHHNRVINKIGILGCRHKMDSSIDTINMNNCNVRLSSVSIDIWLYQPEACVHIPSPQNKTTAQEHKGTLCPDAKTRRKEKHELLQTHVLHRYLD